MARALSAPFSSRLTEPFIGLASPFYVAPALTDSAKSTLTGVEQTALEGALFGKEIPVFVGGESLMGCRIIEGPFLETVSSVSVVSFIATCAVAATPGATRTITSLRLNGTESWTSAGGSIGTPFAGMTVNVKTGTETQTPFASSITRYGSNATAYRSHICVEVINCPLSLFNNEIPFASIFVHEADSITRNDALAALARYARYDDSEFEFDVSGSDKFWIVGQNTQFIPFLAGLRSIFRHWNITATDKLRVIENSADDAISATIVRSNMLANDIELVWDSPLSITSDRALGFIDTGRDNDFNTATAQLERFPVPLTASQDSETIELPIGMTFAEASTLVNDSLQIDDIARKKMRFTAKMALYGMEPGDIFDFSDDPDISLTARIISIARRASDHAIEIEAERVDFSTFANVAPVITSNGGGSTASITINENTTAVTTVTATDANGDPLTYSISGGADAALFGIGASTGVLAFLVAPDYETPTDADSDNAYVVIVQVSDGSMTDTQTITVTVADVSEGGGTADDDFLLLIE